MRTPQPGIFALGTRSHYHLEFDLLAGAEPAALLGALAALREPGRTTGGANLVVGVAPSLWHSVAGEDLPAGADDFTPVVGAEGYAMPATQHSAWVWAAGAGDDTVFDLACATVATLGDCARLADHRRRLQLSQQPGSHRLRGRHGESFRRRGTGDLRGAGR